MPGPWEWDVKRLAASLAVCARERGFSRAVCDEIVLTAMREYRERMADYADLPTLTLWYSRIHIDDVLDHFPSRYRALMERDIARARRKTTRRAIARLTEFDGGRRRFIENPPLSVHVERTDTEMADVDAVVEGYRATLRDDRRTLFDRYRLIDVARRVVGVGSVGTRCWVALFEGPGRPDRRPARAAGQGGAAVRPRAARRRARSCAITASGSSPASGSPRPPATCSSAGRPARAPATGSTSVSCGT